MQHRTLLRLTIIGSLFLSSIAFAQTTQVSGKVVAITASTITLQSGTKTVDISLGQGTTVSGDAKVGATVTVTCPPASVTTNSQKKETPQN